MEKDIQTKSDSLIETIRSVEEFLSDQGDTLSPEEKTKLQAALSQMKEQHSSLTNSVHSSLAQVDTAIVTTQQQNTQRVSSSHTYLSLFHLPASLVNLCTHHHVLFLH